MHLGGQSLGAPGYWKDMERLISKCDSRHGLRYFLAQALVLKHRTQIELTKNTSQLSDHITR